MDAGPIRAATVRERFRPLDGAPPVNPGELTFLALDTPCRSCCHRCSGHRNSIEWTGRQAVRVADGMWL